MTAAAGKDAGAAGKAATRERTLAWSQSSEQARSRVTTQARAFGAGGGRA